jgi:hypothetical protein
VVDFYLGFNAVYCGLLLTTECLVTEIPEKEKPAPMSK